MGVHRERLAASKAHIRFVEGAKSALQRMGCGVPGASGISPTMIGAQPLSFAAPPVMEEALGYRGLLRFVAFGYSPRTRRFGHCDGGDDIPTASDIWLRFMQHPLVSRQLPKNRYPTLYGVFRQDALPSLQELMQSGNQEGKGSEPIHCLLLDRMTRQLYICRRDQAVLLLSLTVPGDKDASWVFIDGLRVSPGCEDYKVPSTPKLASQLLVDLGKAARNCFRKKCSGLSSMIPRL
jgi:hypothetical protein